MFPKQISKPVKLICAFIYSDEQIYEKAKASLKRKFGKIDFESQVIRFDFTDYYYPELGQPLFRKFISFESLKRPSALVKIKLFCLKVEKKYSVAGQRRVNIDPGYLNEAKLVLASSKDFSHRIYLDKGVYAEVTLYFFKGNFCDFPTTFPDYRTETYKKILSSIRRIYRQNIIRNSD